MSSVFDTLQYFIETCEADNDMKFEARVLVDALHDWSHDNKDVLNHIRVAAIAADRLRKMIDKKEEDIRRRLDEAGLLDK